MEAVAEPAADWQVGSAAVGCQAVWEAEGYSHREAQEAAGAAV
jgi:hypothetical protein